MKITALSSFCVDFYPELNEVYVGGNSLNLAVQCDLLGVEDVSVIGAVGIDSWGSLIEEYLDKSNINCSRLYQLKGKTASNKIYISAEGDRYFKAHSWNGGVFDDFRLSDEDWHYIRDREMICMPAGDPNLSELLERRHDRQEVVIDFLDYHPIQFIKERMDKIDISFLSAKPEMLDQLEKLANSSGKMIVATLGAKGSVAFYKGSIWTQQAIELEHIVDTTGCGDAFQAGFMIEWYKSQNIEKALNHGTRIASRVLGYQGGVPHDVAIKSRLNE